MFKYYLSQDNSYYSSMFSDWMKADMKYWSLALSDTSTIWGTPVYGRVWGAGAGPGPSGYSVERIDRSPNLVGTNIISDVGDCL